jgi:hypothetical protein
MALPIVNLDDRSYQDLLDEARARIPVHNPEWTNFNKSDPGITLLELFAFLTENLLFRCNQIPDRNRRKFLSLLGVPLQPASSAQGLVTFSNTRGPLQTVTLSGDIEVRAGQVPFHTEQGLDVLPIEAQVYFKRAAAAPTDQAANDYYTQLYASFLDNGPAQTLQFYETVPLDSVNGLDLAKTIDNSVWVALLVRSGDKPVDDKLLSDVRQQLANRTLSLGIVPYLTDATRQIVPGDAAAQVNQQNLRFQTPVVPANGVLPSDPSLRVAQYRSLPAIFPDQSVLDEPGVVQISLPDAGGLTTWETLDPTEPGVGDFPPALDDTNLNDRVITWLRITPHDPALSTPVPMRLGLLWVGINAVPVTQRAHVADEQLPLGTGEPDQSVTLAQTPVLPDSVSVTVTVNGQPPVAWEPIGDLADAGPEVPTVDPRQPPGSPPTAALPTDVFTVDSESGVLQFGDGTRGARPPFNAAMRASYDYGAGPAGNVAAGAINSGPFLPPGFQVTNPVQTWGGADAESVADAEKQIARYLQHRDRLVTAADFETIALRTPSIHVGRADVLPAYNPELQQNAPGDAAGAVTLMVIPSYDPAHPDTPEPDSRFLDAVCNYLGPRRLVTTELFVRGPTYMPILISVGLRVITGFAVATVLQSVKQALIAFLSPLPATADDRLAGPEALLTTPQSVPKGWPRTKPVIALELLGVANRVPGVQLVVEVQIAEEGGSATPQIDMTGLELPRVVGIAVVVGDPVPVATLALATPSTPGSSFLAVPVQPEVC